LAVGQSFGGFLPRGARSKDDQQPDGRVAHNQKLQTILGIDIGILIIQILRARKSRKCCAQQTDMHIDCENIAYSVGTVYEEKEHLYISNIRPTLLATSCLASLATSRRFTGGHPAL
jgi:hypothetical protein